MYLIVVCSSGQRCLRVLFLYMCYTKCAITIYDYEAVMAFVPFSASGSYMYLRNPFYVHAHCQSVEWNVGSGYLQHALLIT